MEGKWSWIERNNWFMSFFLQNLHPFILQKTAFLRGFPKPRLPGPVAGRENLLRKPMNPRFMMLLSHGFGEMSTVFFIFFYFF
jgi:hypothetical protein